MHPHQSDDGPATGPRMNPPLRILFLEDSPVDAELEERQLRKGGLRFQAQRATTREEFEKALEEFRPDVVLADYALPEYDGLSALRCVLERRHAVPFIFVSGTIGEEFAVEGLKKGATDYILKGQPARLCPAVERALQEAAERRERDRAQDALRESEKRFRRLIESVTDYIYTVQVRNGAAVSTVHGPSCVTVTGYESNEYDADPYLWYRMVHASDRERVKAWIDRLLAGESTAAMEHRIHRKDGAVRWVRHSLVPKYDETGSLCAYDGLIADVTERKTAEEAVKRYSEELEEKVRERTAEVEESRRELESAKVRAETASKSKSDFLANMSHELRTPLNSILGFSDVLLDELFGPLNAKQREYVRDINESGQHLLSLINDILDLSKVESGRQELDLAEFAVNTLLGAAMAMFKEKSAKNGVALSLDAQETDGLVIEADARKFKQVMFNLLSNAVKFTPAGGSVRVRARRIERPAETDAPHAGPGVEIAVEDTGIGIKPGDLDKLFKPFSQIDSSYTRSHEGTGLGLALAHRLVALHGGRLRVESEFGKGSVFIVSLPLHPARTRGDREGER